MVDGPFQHKFPLTAKEVQRSHCAVWQGVFSFQQYLNRITYYKLAKAAHIQYMHVTCVFIYMPRIYPHRLKFSYQKQCKELVNQLCGSLSPL